MLTTLLLTALSLPAAAGDDGPEPVIIKPTQRAPENTEGFDFEADIALWSESWEQSGEVLGDSYDTPAGELSWEVLSYDAVADASVGFDDDGLELELSAEAGAYLARVEYTAEAYAGSEQTHVSVGAEAETYVGAEANAIGELELGLDGVELEVCVEAFAGAKAEGEIPVDLAVCDLGVEGSVGGEASAGVGGTVEAELEAEWSDLEFSISGELAGTLGLGAGGEGEVTLDLGGLLDPAGTADCFWDYAWGAGEVVVGAADSIWDAGWELGGDVIGGLTDLGGGLLSGIGGLLGGRDELGKAAGEVLNAAKEQARVHAVQGASELVLSLDHYLAPRPRGPGMCF